MLPLKDDIRSRTLPFMTYIFIAVNILVFIYQISLGQRLQAFVMQFGAIPYNIFHPRGLSSYLTIFSSMFMHANLAHIIGNMLFFWVFADNIEDRLGHFMFIIFYLVCGVAAALCHGLTATNSTVPMIGASGAISGILGAYVLLYPKARVLALIPLGFFMRATYLPSYVFLGIWFLFQFLYGISSLGQQGGGVAYFAHIGGFATGLLFALPFKFIRRKNLDYKIL